ncbi:MAG: transcription antitermination factor NusB [Lachnospiraceae bacterium]
MTRTQLREQLFKLLFRVEFNKADDMPEQVDLFLADDEVIYEDVDSDYIEMKFNKILEALPRLDALIEEKAEGWTNSRIGKVELTILRLAIYEILEDDSVPAGVAINEAVELAKKFGQDHAGSFINGVLAKFVQD